jgi:hypothetical protein
VGAKYEAVNIINVNTSRNVSTRLYRRLYLGLPIYTRGVNDAGRRYSIANQRASREEVKIKNNAAIATRSQSKFKYEERHQSKLGKRGGRC